MQPAAMNDIINRITPTQLKGGYLRTNCICYNKLMVSNPPPFSSNIYSVNHMSNRVSRCYWWWVVVEVEPASMCDVVDSTITQLMGTH